MNRACAGQTVLDLFPAPPRDHVEDTLKWMCDVHGCIRDEIEGDVSYLAKRIEIIGKCTKDLEKVNRERIEQLWGSGNTGKERAVDDESDN